VGHTGRVIVTIPQWQGAAAKAMPARYHRGAEVIAERFDQFPRIDVPVSGVRDLTKIDGVVAKSTILETLRRSLLVTERIERPMLVVGGDCSVDLVTVAWSRARGGANSVIYVDAHGDLNDPTGSPSGAFHGMVLRMMLGDGDAEALSLIGDPTPPERVILAGARVFDEPERLVIAARRIEAVTVESLSAEIVGALPGWLHVHLDLDVLDPTEFQHTTYPTLGGPSVASVATMLSHVVATGRLGSMAITECIATRADEVDVLEPIFDAVRSWLAA
jgi:arginase